MKKILFTMNDKLVIEAKERDKTYQLENNSCFIEIECDTEGGYAYKLHIEKGDVKEYVLLDKTDVGLECVLTSGILNAEGSYKVQIEKVSDDYRMVSNAVRFHVGDFINAEHIPTPEEEGIIDELIIKIQRVEDRVDNAEDNITELERSVETLGETKVDKEEGKGLSSNDFTNEDKTKLDSLENYDDTEVREMISDEIADRQLSENILSSAITSEGNARKSAVSSLNNAITTETSARKSADTTINNRIAAEENARKQSFNSLDGRIVILGSEIPKKTSQLTNDSGFVTGSVVRTVNHTAPDENGNVDVQGGTGDVTKAYVDEQDNLIRDDVQALDDKIKDLELFKFPNATIVGEPIIDNGQVSGFSSANYLQFPFIVDVRNRPFEIDVCFTTGSDVTTQQNILDSQFGLALAVMNGKGIMAMSSNGTTWDIGQATGVINIDTNTTYYAKISWDGSVYKTAISTDGTTYVDDMSLTDSRGLFPKTIFIGGSYGLFGAGTDHPFKGTINLNNCKLSIDGLVVWVGMDDAGLATRADVSLSNIDADGVQKIKDIAGGLPSYFVTHVEEGGWQIKFGKTEFNGTDIYIDSGVALFSEDNFDRDFEFEMEAVNMKNVQVYNYQNDFMVSNNTTQFSDWGSRMPCLGIGGRYANRGMGILYGTDQLLDSGLIDVGSVNGIITKPIKINVKRVNKVITTKMYEDGTLVGVYSADFNGITSRYAKNMLIGVGQVNWSAGAPGLGFMNGTMNYFRFKWLDEE